ncbi:MAG TPA: fumarate hydratase C-terminal domain-containing protein [Spirochaetota bacterium]|nr:fumarate hydratase C-terminal domain-containing protein [Spirochaetota bacterium]
MNWIQIQTPLDDETVNTLRTGDAALFSGVLYAARDKAHERMRRMIENGEALPFDPRGQVIYFMGPSPAPPGRVIGSAGPTTSYRMDPFAGTMCGAGVKGFIGKGKRSAEARGAMMKCGAVYFSTFGGAGAYLSRRIVSSSEIAFDDLGPEAIYRLEVAGFPAIVINDIFGGDLYEDALSKRG